MIENSNWNHRLWTFQEGVLARDLEFQMYQDSVGFADLVQQFEHHFRPLRVPINVATPMERHEEHNDPYALKILRAIATWNDDTDHWLLNISADEELISGSEGMLGYKTNFWAVHDIADTVIADCYRRVLRIKLVDNPDNEWIHHFSPDRFVNRVRSMFRLHPRNKFVDEVNKVCNLLRFHLTSKLMDEPICLGNLLGLDVSFVSKHNTPEARMAAFHQLLKNNVLVRFLFLETTKLRIDGFRWAPASFLDKGGKVSYEPHSVLERRASIRPSGLELTAAGLFLNMVPAEKLPECPERCHFARLTFPEGSRQRPNWARYNRKCLALMYTRDLRAQENIASLKKRGEWITKQFSLMTGGAAVVSVQATKGKVVYARYEWSAFTTIFSGTEKPAPKTFAMTMSPFSQRWIVA